MLAHSSLILIIYLNVNFHFVRHITDLTRHRATLVDCSINSVPVTNGGCSDSSVEDAPPLAKKTSNKSCSEIGSREEGAKPGVRPSRVQYVLLAISLVIKSPRTSSLSYDSSRKSLMRMSKWLHFNHPEESLDPSKDFIGEGV